MSVASGLLQRSTILVSGAPGTGKSTVARSLAEAFRFALISKDTIKESLFDSFGARLGKQIDSPDELSRVLSRAAIDLVWSLAPYCPDVILEANFRPKSEGERTRFAALEGRKLEVYCHCTAEEAARRFRDRATTERHHPAHSMKSISAEMLREYDQPFKLCPVIDVNTERPVDPAEIAGRICGHWPDLRMANQQL
jgi:predicted kinase